MRAKSDAPRRFDKARRGVFNKIPAATYSPTRKPCSTIGSGGLNFRVRDGNGWDPSDIATGNSRFRAPGGKQRNLHTRKNSCDGLQTTELDLGLRGIASASGSRRKND